jgi:hypothetical protein
VGVSRCRFKGSPFGGDPEVPSQADDIFLSEQALVGDALL